METGFSMQRMEYSKRHHLQVPSSLTLLLPIVLLKMVLIRSKKKFNVILICQMKQLIKIITYLDMLEKGTLHAGSIVTF